jgi:integrase
MPLTLYKRETGNWRLRGTVRGSYINETTGTSDKKAAEAIRVNREKSLLDESVHGKKAVVTFEQAAVSYLDAGGSTRYVKGLAHRFKGRRISGISQDDLDSAAKKICPDAKPQTLNRHIYTPFIAIWNHAAAKGWCDKRDWIRPRTKEVRQRRFATLTELTKMEEAAASHLKPMILFLALTGVRIGEALALQWEDVDLIQQWAVLRDTKRGVPRGVPLHPMAVFALCTGTISANKGPVFRTHKGLPYAEKEVIGGGQVKRAWATMLKNAGVTGLTPHSLRHTFATYATAVGMSDHDKKLIMGHSTSEMSERYTHIPQPALIAAVSLLPYGTSAESVRNVSPAWIIPLIGKDEKDAR